MRARRSGQCGRCVRVSATGLPRDCRIRRHGFRHGDAGYARIQQCEFDDLCLSVHGGVGEGHPSADVVCHHVVSTDLQLLHDAVQLQRQRLCVVSIDRSVRVALPRQIHRQAVEGAREVGKD
jgi:hypothetical protein